MASDLTIVGAALLIGGSFSAAAGGESGVELIQWSFWLLGAGVLHSAIAWGIREFDVLE